MKHSGDYSLGETWQQRPLSGQATRVADHALHLFWLQATFLLGVLSAL